MRSLLALLVVALFAAPGCDSAEAPASDPDAVSAQLFPVRQNGKPALIDSTGRVVRSLDTYNATAPGAGGYVPARYWDGQRNVWDFLDASGEVAFSVVADGVEAPRGGRARMWIDGKSGFVDTDGRFVVNPYLNDARSFREGFARVKTTGWQWGLLGADGQVAVAPAFDELADVSDGLARVKRRGAYGFIDVTGAEVVPAVYTEARSFRDGLAAVRDGQRWVYIDRDNRRVMGGTSFISAGDFGSGLAPVRTENLWEYVGASGARVLEPRFEDARAFVGGRAAVKLDGRWTFIDRSGALLGPPRFDEVSDFENGLAAVVVGGKTGYVDRSGNYVWVPRG